MGERCSSFELAETSGKKVQVQKPFSMSETKPVENLRLLLCLLKGRVRPELWRGPQAASSDRQHTHTPPPPRDLHTSGLTVDPL